MKKKDFLAQEFEKIIRAYDDEGEIDERDYNKLGRIFSSVVRTSPEIRELFFDKVREISIKMKKMFDAINRNVTSEKKEKIYN